MGQQQSKDELLYQKAIDADIEAIKALCSQGAGLEWIDKEGKTPLIVACMNPDRYILAKTLIGLGANVNAYRPGRHVGTPLHHAAKRGLDLTVRLLLSHGANPFLRNDDCQSPLDVARFRGFTNVVRTIESHIFLFSGWVREFYGPGFLEVLAPQLLSRKSWVVIIPCGPRNPTKPLKLELAVYSNLQDAQPRAVVALWKANIEEPKFHQPDPMLIIFDKSTKKRYKFASTNDGDRQQIQSMYLACRGIPQVMPYSGVHDTQPSAPTTSTQTAEEGAEIAMAINASIQSAMENRLPLQPHNHQISGTDKLNGWVDTPSDTVNNGWGSASRSSHPVASSSGWINEPTKEQQNGWGVPKSRLNNDQIQANYVTPQPPSQTSGGINEPSKEEYGGWGVPQSRLNNNLNQSPKVNNSGWLDDPAKEEYNGWEVAESMPTNNATEEATYIPQSCNVPSAPPVTMEVLDEGPIQYPSIDFSPVDLSTPCVESENAGTSSEAKDEDGSSCCVICWEAPVEGACIPCGHMAGCMSCLNEVKNKKGDCPVCRTEIKQVIKLYAV